MLKKSHTCQESEAHPRISFWYLGMNSKNKYLLKKQLSGPIKKQNDFNIYNVAFLKITKNTWKYHYLTPAYQKRSRVPDIYSVTD